MDAPISSDASVSSAVSGLAVDWVERHRRLRAQLRWVLPVGGLLLVLLAYQLAVYPSRAALGGYRYQQVGVQPDSTWWILAYRDGKAEILFSRGTARGWQRRALGVDSAQARSLALNWGGKVLLVGDGGAVRVYDSLFRPVDSVRYPLGKGFRVRWVAADKSGLRAVALGDSGTALFSADGGKSWHTRVPPAGLILKQRSVPEYWRERAAFGRNDELALASRSEYLRVSTGVPLAYTGSGQWITIEGIAPTKAGARFWAPPKDSVPLIYFRLGATGLPQLLRQDGSAKSEGRYYTPAEITSQFPIAARPIDAAFSPTRPGFCLLISRTQVFAGRLGGLFASISPVEAEPTDSGAAKADSLKPLKNQVGTTAAILNKKTTASTSKAKKSTPSAQKKAAPKSPATTKSRSPSSPTKETKESNKPPETSNNTKSDSSPKQESKAEPPNPVQQTTAPANQNYQQSAPPASDTREKETTPPKLGNTR